MKRVWIKGKSKYALWWKAKPVGTQKGCCISWVKAVNGESRFLLWQNLRGGKALIPNPALSKPGRTIAYFLNPMDARKVAESL